MSSQPPVPVRHSSIEGTLPTDGSPNDSTVVCPPTEMHTDRVLGSAPAEMCSATGWVLSHTGCVQGSVPVVWVTVGGLTPAEVRTTRMPTTYASSKQTCVSPGDE